MEQSKVNDMDATQFCREILRPYFAKGAYALNDGRYMIADADGCHRSTENRVRVPLMIEPGTPVDAVMIDPENVANYCEAHGTDIDQLRKDLAAYYFIYYKTMLCALIKLRGRREAARWARDWRAQGNVFAPIAAAVLILRGKETNAEERERLTHVYTKSLIMSKPAFIYNDMPVYLRKYAERAYIEEQAETITAQIAPERLQPKQPAANVTQCRPMSAESRELLKRYCDENYTKRTTYNVNKNFDTEEQDIYKYASTDRGMKAAARIIREIYDKHVSNVWKITGKKDVLTWKRWLTMWGEAYGIKFPKYESTQL